MDEQTQFSLSELPVVIEEIWDESDGETVLTLVTHGEHGVSGFLELYVEADDEGAIDAWWKWTVNEPRQQEAYFGSNRLLMNAAVELKASLESMAEFVLERDGD